MDNAHNATGENGERKVGAKLRKLGFTAIRMPYAHSTDLLVEDARVEVKCARPSEKGYWVVNIHRHGVLKEGDVDAYVICLEDVPGNNKMPIYLVYKAPIGRSVLSFSFSSLIRQHRNAIDNWDALREVCSKKAVEANRQR